MGRQDYVPPKEFRNNRISTGVVYNKELVIIKSGEVQDYFTDEFWQYYNIFVRSEILGIMPNGNIGWANEPINIVEALTVFKSEQNAIDKEELERSGNDH